MTMTGQLPRGRHGLSREEVERSQRDRILLALAEAMAENGYVGTSVAEILRRAKVSRETFYELFRSKEHCFKAAFSRGVEVLIARIGDAGASESDEQDVDRMERLLGAYLDGLAAEPAFARVFLVEVYAAGADALAWRARVQSAFVDVIANALNATTDEQRFACQTLAGAISSMVTARIAAGDVDGVRALRTPLLDMVRRSGDLYGTPHSPHTP